MVGNDSASQIYVKNKSKACEEIGIQFEEYLLEEHTTIEELQQLIYELNQNPQIHGILLQSPIPSHLDINQAFKSIAEEKDVDGFHPNNVGKLCLGQDCFVPCTPYGIIKLLEEYQIPIEGKHAVIVGRSNIVGKPLAQMLLNRNATVTICHSRTKNLADITKTADILVSAVGGKIIGINMIQSNCVVVDVGIFKDENGKTRGDVDFDTVAPLTSYITPVPGGVGPMTIAMLMSNTVELFEKNL